jgi:hypothetical protein
LRGPIVLSDKGRSYISKYVTKLCGVGQTLVIEMETVSWKHR